MLVLLALGRGLERAIGHVRLGLVFLAGGLLGLFGEKLLHAASTTPLCGASVGVAAVWMAWLLHLRASQQALLPEKAHEQPARRLARLILQVLICILALVAAWEWFGYSLLAAVNGAGLRIFWSRSFTAHLFGALAGGLLAGGYYMSRLLFERCGFVRQSSAKPGNDV